MQNLKSKTMAILIALFLTISMSASMILVPSASAHTPPQNNPTIAFINVAPSPCGLGQSVNVGFWLAEPPPTATGPYGDRWMGMMVKITLPDGTTVSMGPYTSDDTGGTHFQYTPTELGNYTFQMTFPGQVLAGANPPPTGYSSTTAAFINDTYLPATSNVFALTVQQNAIPAFPIAPLPTSYWETPVSALNVNNWYSVSGASLDLGGTGKYNYSSNYNPYSLAPLTSHIIWTKPEAFGGVLGGEFGGTTTYGNYYSTSQYERKYNPVIINGFLYYNVFPGSSTTPTGLICVDLYTGQTVWNDNGDNFGGGSSVQTALISTGVCTTLKCGQILDFVSPNQYGGLAYLWTTGTPVGINVSAGSTTLNLFDAETGTYILSIVNGTSPSFVEDQGGNLIGYYVNATTGSQTLYSNLGGNIVGTKVTNTGPMLTMWNSTLCVQNGAWSAQASGWYWRPPQDGVISFQNGIQWVAPIATNYTGNSFPSNLAIWAINSGTIVMDTEAPSGGSFFQGGWGVFAAYSTTTGQQQWIENLTLTPLTATSLNCAWLAGNGVWTTITKETQVVNGYSMATGALLWSDNLAPFNPYDSIGGDSGVIAGTTLYLFAFGGDVWSINMLNGDINWQTSTTAIQGPAGNNSPYGTWPIWEQTGIGMADGLIFLEEGHEYSPPLFLGAQQLAINATNGNLVWSIDAFDVDGLPVTAYGVMTSLNAYDNQIYAYAQGPSKMTVSAPSVGVTTATPVTITGTVMDNSAGSQQAAVAANFPNGLPCVSDASMSQFMEAVYEQQPMPTNITGVPVTIAVTDANGNCYVIGTTTSDASGTYSLNWTPTITGNYTVTATFAGTGSYYGSTAEAHFYANAPAATPAPTAAPASNLATTADLMTYIVVAAIAIIIAVAVVGLLILRKKP